VGKIEAAGARPGFTKATVSASRVSLEERRPGSSFIIIRTSAIRKLARNLARRIEKVLHRRQTYGNSNVYSTLLRFSERFSVWFLHFFDEVLGIVWQMVGSFCAALAGI